jgi:membrane-associated protein
MSALAFLHQAVDLFLHLDVHLAAIIAQFGVLTYVILFVIIFCETGLVVTPFLPGDSLLFAAGAFAAKGSFNVVLLFFLLWLAASLGDACNYAIGALVGPHIFLRLGLLKQKHLDKAHGFYERHGGKAIVFAQFIPVVRTIVPFVAGVARMTYSRFALFNISGTFAWVGLFVFAGFFFGGIPMIEKNFSLVILAIIVISSLPPLVEFLRSRRAA